MKLISAIMEHTQAYRLWQAPFAENKLAPVLSHNDLRLVRQFHGRRPLERHVRSDQRADAPAHRLPRDELRADALASHTFDQRSQHVELFEQGVDVLDLRARAAGNAVAAAGVARLRGSTIQPAAG
jgi:hypothetical protein